MTTYAAGLRMRAVVRLQDTDIESGLDRLVIRVNQGKGTKDRSTLLSTRLVHALHASGCLERQTPWFFPGHDSTRTAWRFGQNIGTSCLST